MPHVRDPLTTNRAGRAYRVEVANQPFNLPYSNVFYSLLNVGDFPAWGNQPFTDRLSRAWNEAAREAQQQGQPPLHQTFVVGDIAYAEGMAAHWDVSLRAGCSVGCDGRCADHRLLPSKHVRFQEHVVAPHAPARSPPPPSAPSSHTQLYLSDFEETFSTVPAMFSVG
jgi:hypothetical protein